MPPFIADIFHWAAVTGRHFVFMLWWVWALAVALTALSESFFFDSWRHRVLEARNDGWRTVARAEAGSSGRRRNYWLAGSARQV